MQQRRAKGDVAKAPMSHRQDYYERFKRDCATARDPGEVQQPTLSSPTRRSTRRSDRRPLAAPGTE
ncbi:hypothetical protein WT22_14180 [Burkholderia territorii]|nr:hypothetical protein WT22_14180 [Burkholderia territorii]KWA29686.1 hypothetical protein WT40_28075 [Burkholderia territorii]